LHNFHDANNGFPPAKQTSPTTHAWIAFILPYLEQKPLFDLYRFDVNWDDAATNDADGGVNQTLLSVLLCPSAPGGRLATRNRGLTDYDAISRMTRPNPFVTNMPPSDPTWIGILGLNVRRKIVHIADGASNTLLVAESAGREQLWQMGGFVQPSGTIGAWANPDAAIVVTGFDPGPGTVIGPCAVNCSNRQDIYAFHSGLANVLFGDGSVRGLRSRLDINIVIALTTRSMGDIIPPDALD